MRCLTINCLHSVRSKGKRGKSWNLYQICPCCAYELHCLNLNDRMFYDFRTKAIKRCMMHEPNRKHRKPFTSYVLEIILVRPSSKDEILAIMKKAFDLRLTGEQLNHVIQELKQQKLITRNGPKIYPVHDLIEVPA